MGTELLLESTNRVAAEALLALAATLGSLICMGTIVTFLYARTESEYIKASGENKDPDTLKDFSYLKKVKKNVFLIISGLMVFILISVFLSIGQLTNVGANTDKNADTISHQLNLTKEQGLELTYEISKLNNKNYYNKSDGNGAYRLKTEIVNNDNSFRQIVLETKDKKNIKILFNKDIQATNYKSK